MKKENKKKSIDILKKINFKRKSSKAKDKFLEMLNLPRELSGDYAKITMIENNELLIEGSTNVVDYYEDYISVKCENLFLKISGKKLLIEDFCDTELLISGQISNISFECR